MSERKFKIGQFVLFYPRVDRGLSVTHELYIVIMVLSEKDGRFHYRIRSQADEACECTAMESELRVPSVQRGKLHRPGK